MVILLLKLLVLIINFYKILLSPIIGNNCIFHPSCSTYGLQAINKFGIFGIWLVLKRILRCHSLSNGGYDPIPNKNNVNLKEK